MDRLYKELKTELKNKEAEFKTEFEKRVKFEKKVVSKIVVFSRFSEKTYLLTLTQKNLCIYLFIYI